MLRRPNEVASVTIEPLLELGIGYQLWGAYDLSRQARSATLSGASDVAPSWSTLRGSLCNLRNLQRATRRNEVGAFVIASQPEQEVSSILEGWEAIGVATITHPISSSREAQLSYWLGSVHRENFKTNQIVVQALAGAITANAGISSETGLYAETRAGDVVKNRVLGALGIFQRTEDGDNFHWRASTIAVQA